MKKRSVVLGFVGFAMQTSSQASRARTTPSGNINRSCQPRLPTTRHAVINKAPGLAVPMCNASAVCQALRVSQ